MSDTQGYKIGTTVTGQMTAKTRRYVLYILRLRVIDCNRNLKRVNGEADDVAAAHWSEELADAQAAIAELEAL